MYGSSGPALANDFAPKDTGKLQHDGRASNDSVLHSQRNSVEALQHDALSFNAGG